MITMMVVVREIKVREGGGGTSIFVPLGSTSISKFLPLRRPPFSTYIYIQAVPAPPIAGLLRQARTQSFHATPGFQPARVPARRVLYKSAPVTPISCSSPGGSGATNLHARARSVAPHFHSRLAPGALHPRFSLGRGTYLPKSGVSSPFSNPPAMKVLMSTVNMASCSLL